MVQEAEGNTHCCESKSRVQKCGCSVGPVVTSFFQLPVMKIIESSSLVQIHSWSLPVHHESYIYICTL